jgi:hypothetical protein
LVIYPQTKERILGIFQAAVNPEIGKRGREEEVVAARRKEDIHITDNAIIPLKERVVDEFYDPLLMLVRKIRGAKTA